MTKKQLIGSYNYNEGTIKYKNDLIFLTDTDNKIFKVLLDNYKNIVRIEILCKKVYNENFDEQYDKSLRTAVSRLRRKVKNIVDIDCKYKFGYKLELKRKSKW